MTKGKTHIDEKTFRRYRNNKMTDAERNTFEKELQKNPFEAEAFEGFVLLSTQKLEQDLNELENQIHTPKKKKRTPYFAAAATILLLVTAGVIWLQLEKQNTVPKITENKIKQVTKTEEPAEKIIQDKIEKSSPIITEKEDNIQTKQKPNIQPTKEIQVHKKASSPRSALKIQEEKVVVHQGEAKTATLEMADDKSELDNEIMYATPAVQTENKALTQALRSVAEGTVVSADDQQPIAGVTIVQKGTNKGVFTDINGHFTLPLDKDSSATLIASFVGMETNEFKPNKDSNAIIKLKASELAMDEVAVVGYGTKQRKNVTGSATVVNAEPRNSEATPLGGYDNYNEYLDKNAILPDNYPEKKLVVKLKLEIDSDGNIALVTNANNANDEYFIKAKTLVKNGPDWQAKYYNDRRVKSSIKLRIVFRKTEK